jgi:hypothetical protein
MMSVEQQPLNPGDLIYMRDPETGTVFTDRMWTVAAVEDLVTHTGQKLSSGLTYGGPIDPDRPLRSVQVHCDGRCTELGYGDCPGRPYPHFWYLAADEFVHVSRLPEFEVTR